MEIPRSASTADFVFTVNKYSDEIRVISFTGTEGISELFRYDLKLASKDSRIDFNTIVGQRACLGIYNETGERYVNGIITRFEQNGSGNGYSYYQAIVMPMVWLLSLNRKCRIYQEKSVQDIIQQILTEAYIDNKLFRFALKGTHKPYEYRVQYRESDFDFISRLMEEEGIFYFFEHSDNGHTMVIADDPSVHVPIESPKVIFNEPSGTVPKFEHVYEFGSVQQIRSGMVSLRDFNFEKPSLNLEVNSKSGVPDDEMREVYDYPGKYLDEGKGSELAKLRLEAIRSDLHTVSGHSLCGRFVPGFRFTLDMHPRSDFNQEYLITRITNSGKQPSVEGSEIKETNYSNDFECIPFIVPYRSTEKTHKPIVEGIQTAIVVGPSGKDIYTDKYGRVKVQFHWDREGQMSENSSCWVRVSSGYAGQKHGIQFTPLLGDEVVVDFLEGDPDKPLIVGRVYNGDNMPPLIPEDTIQNVILTPYQHRMLLDDKNTNITINTGGKETIKMTDAKNDKDFGNNINISTADNHFIQLADGIKAQGITISTLKGNIVVLDDKNENITVKTTNGHFAILDDKNKKIEIQSTDAHRITIDDKGKNITVIDSSKQHKFQIDIGGEKIIISTDSGSINMLAPSGTVVIKANQIQMEASQSIEVEAGTEIKMIGMNITEEALVNVKIKGTNVASEAGAQHSIKGGTVSAQASAVHTITGVPVKIN